VIGYVIGSLFGARTKAGTRTDYGLKSTCFQAQRMSLRLYEATSSMPWPTAIGLQGVATAARSGLFGISSRAGLGQRSRSSDRRGLATWWDRCSRSLLRSPTAPEYPDFASLLMLRGCPLVLPVAQPPEPCCLAWWEAMNFRQRPGRRLQGLGPSCWGLDLVCQQAWNQTRPRCC